MSTIPPAMTRPYSADALIKKKTFASTQGHGSHRNNSDIEAILNSRRKNQNTERSKNSASFFQLGVSRASTPSILYRERPDTAPTKTIPEKENQETQTRNNDSRLDFKPAKKINTDNIHKTAYSLKVKQEAVEDKIKRLEHWQDSMKRNEIWNTPQAHIMKQVLEFSSQNNPSGIVSQYLSEEKEKKAQKYSKRVRYSKTPNPTARKLKTVEQFFKDDEAEVNNEITSIIKSGPVRRAVSREEVSQKLNTYLSLMKSFQSTNMEGKEIITPRQKDLLDPATPINDESAEVEGTARSGNKLQAESTLQTDRHPGNWESNSEMLSNKLVTKKKEFLAASIPLRMSSEGLYRRSAGVTASRMNVQLPKNNPSLERSNSEIRLRGSNDQSTSTIRPQTKGTLFTNNQLPVTNFVNRPMMERDLNARKFFEGKRGFSRKDQDVRTLSIDSRYLKSYKPGIMIHQQNHNSNVPGKSVLRSWVSINNQTENSNTMYEQSHHEVKVQ